MNVNLDDIEMPLFRISSSKRDREEFELAQDQWRDLLDNFHANLKIWKMDYRHLGAGDTAVREAMAITVAKSFGLNYE